MSPEHNFNHEDVLERYQVNEDERPVVETILRAHPDTDVNYLLHGVFGVRSSPESAQAEQMFLEAINSPELAGYESAAEATFHTTFRSTNNAVLAVEAMKNVKPKQVAKEEKKSPAGARPKTKEQPVYRQTEQEKVVMSDTIAAIRLIQRAWQMERWTIVETAQDDERAPKAPRTDILARRAANRPARERLLAACALTAGGDVAERLLARADRLAKLPGLEETVETPESPIPAPERPPESARREAPAEGLEKVPAPLTQEELAEPETFERAVEDSLRQALAALPERPVRLQIVTPEPGPEDTSRDLVRQETWQRLALTAVLSEERALIIPETVGRLEALPAGGGSKELVVFADDFVRLEPLPPATDDDKPLFRLVAPERDATIELDEPIPDRLRLAGNGSANPDSDPGRLELGATPERLPTDEIRLRDDRRLVAAGPEDPTADGGTRLLADFGDSVPAGYAESDPPLRRIDGEDTVVPEPSEPEYCEETLEAPLQGPRRLVGARLAYTEAGDGDFLRIEEPFAPGSAGYPLAAAIPSLHEHD